MKGLHAIVDTKLLAKRDVDPLAYARAVLPAKPGALQLRAKDAPPREILGLLRTLGPLCRQARVPLIVNDRADLAALGGCDGVHIGQEDLPYELVHRIAPQLLVGLSAHSPDQIGRALAVRPSYIAFGPIFASSSKTWPVPVVGLEGLALAATRAREAGVTLVATGGVTLARLDEIASLVDAWAVIGDLFPEGATLDDVRARAESFQARARTVVAPAADVTERREGA